MSTESREVYILWRKKDRKRPEMITDLKREGTQATVKIDSENTIALKKELP